MIKKMYKNADGNVDNWIFYFRTTLNIKWNIKLSFKLSSCNILFSYWPKEKIKLYIKLCCQCDYFMLNNFLLYF